MGVYTQSIREILQMNKTAQQDLKNVNDVYNIANSVLFDDAPMNVISSQYREQFITGFTLHFFNEELGLETLSLWKIALNDKLYNYGTYINQIYENLDKQVFADYSVKRVETSGSKDVEKHGTGTVQNERNEDTTTDVTDTLTHSETIDTTTAGTVAGTGTIANAKTGTDTLRRTGTDTDAKTGYDTLNRTGTDTNEHTGTDTVERTGTDENAHTGTQGTVGTTSDERHNTGTTSNDHNSQQINSDTPMGSLQNLRTPGGNAKGTGVSYANGQTYNYMSGAVEFDESNVQTDNTTQTGSGSSSDTTTFNDTNTETRDLTDETTYNTQDERTLNLEDQQNYNSTNTRTLNLSDATQYGATNTETRNTLDTTSKTDNVEKSGSDGKVGQTVVDGTVTDEQTRNLTDTEAVEHSDETDETNYSLNWEMLYKSMPLLNRVWGLFDDLFMLIY